MTEEQTETQSCDTRADDLRKAIQSTYDTANLSTEQQNRIRQIADELQSGNFKNAEEIRDIMINNGIEESHLNTMAAAVFQTAQQCPDNISPADLVPPMQTPATTQPDTTKER